jgi:hypothetical protein
LGIRGIRVPRATGTCTRCPLYIKLSSSPEGSPWTAKVLLRRQYQYGRGLVASRNAKFVRWDEKDNVDIIEFEGVKGRKDWGTLLPVPTGSPALGIKAVIESYGIHYKRTFLAWKSRTWKE